MVGHLTKDGNTREIDVKEIDQFLCNNDIYYMEQSGPLLENRIDCFHIIISMILKLNMFSDEGMGVNDFT